MSEPWRDEPEPEEKRVEYALVWRFINQSPEFVFGVEAGIINEQMQRREQMIQRTVHAENEDELRNLANSFGYRSDVEPLGEDGQWIVATFTRNNAEL